MRPRTFNSSSRIALANGTPQSVSGFIAATRIVASGSDQITLTPVYAKAAACLDIGLAPSATPQNTATRTAHKIGT